MAESEDNPAAAGDLAVLVGATGQCKLGVVDEADAGGRVRTLRVGTRRGERIQTPAYWVRIGLVAAEDLRVAPGRLARLCDQAGHAPFDTLEEARAWVMGHLTPAALDRGKRKEEES